MTEKTENRQSNAFYVVEEFRQAFKALGLSCIQDVFEFDQGQDLHKANLASFRSRSCFQTGSPARTFFLKRYDHPPIRIQLANWIDARRRRSCCQTELKPIQALSAHQVGTAKPVAYGQVWGWLFEKQSFLVTEEIADGASLEKRLPACFYAASTAAALHERRIFIRQLARFIRRFHDLGYRHRDLYLAHIFCDTKGELYLIDLARAFRPILRRHRFLIKDLAQVFYSMPAQYFSRTDRLRAYLHYAGKERLSRRDKSLVRSLVNKAKRMARHDSKRGKDVPFLSWGNTRIELHR